MEITQKRKITWAAIIVMSSIVLSRITGFVRAALIPNMIPSPEEKDAFFMAFRITDLMYNLLIGGAMSSALIPTLTGYIARDEEEDGWKAVGTFINIVFLLMVVISILGMIFSPWIVNIMAPEFDTETKALTAELSRILFPSVSFLMLAGLTNGVLNSYQRFAAASYGPSFYNIGCALSIFFLSRYGVKSIVMGIMFSAAGYFLLQMFFAAPNLKFYRPKIYMRHPGLKKLIKLAVPSFISSSIMQINSIISTVYTGLLAVGSITAYTMANDIWQLPYGIFATGMGMAVLPSMSESIAIGKREDYKTILEKSLKSVLMLVIPSSIGLIVLGKPVTSVIYRWSRVVTPSDIAKVNNILVFFSLALLSHSALAIINRAYYAANDTKTPLFAGTGAIVVNALLSMIFLKFTSLDASGMALAYSISSFLSILALVIILDRKMNGIYLRRIAVFILKAVAASFVMGMVLHLTNRFVPIDYSAEFSIKSKLAEVFFLALQITVGAAVYFSSVLIMKVEEAQYALGLAVKKCRTVMRKIFCIFRK